MKTISAFTATTMFGLCFANVAEVNAQGHAKTIHKAPTHVAAPRAAVVVNRAAGAGVGVNNARINNGNLNGGYVNHAATLHNPGNIYTNTSVYSSGYNTGYNNSGYNAGYNTGYNGSGYNANNYSGYGNFDFLTPAPYIGPTGAGYYFPGLINPYGIYNYGPGYNYGYNTYGLGRLNNSAANLNLKLNFYPPGTGTGLVLGVASVPSDTPRASSGPVEVADGKATVQIVAPTADAEVMLDDFTTKGAGLERSFKTPVLELGYRYGYNVTAVWIKDGEQIRETRNVEVFPGQVTVVDFSRPAIPEMVAVMPEKSGSADR